MRDIRLDRLRTIAVLGIAMIHAFYRTGYFEAVPELSAGGLGGMAVYTAAFSLILYLLGMGGDGPVGLYFDSSAFVAVISFILVILTLKQKKTSGGKFWPSLARGSLTVCLIHEQPVGKQILWAAEGSGWSGALPRHFRLWYPREWQFARPASRPMECTGNFGETW